MLIKLAFRNLFRNTRRTMLSLVMIAGGFASVVVFQGFAQALLENVRWSTVNGQYGHIQVAKQKMWDPDPDDVFRDRQMDIQEQLKNEISKFAGVKSVAARQFFYGLVSTGDQSVAAQIIGYEPHIESEVILPEMIVEGKGFSPRGSDGRDKLEVAVGLGLARILKVKPGQTLTVIGQTADGGVNAVDADLVAIFRNGVKEIDDTTAYVPLSFSQKILDSDSVERVVVKLNEHDLVDDVFERVAKLLPSEMKAKKWRELAHFYNQTEAYFDTQNGVVTCIILALILLSVTSTVGISVSERTGEIGTTRALGDRKGEVLRQFAIEGVILGALGGVAGAVLGFVTSIALTSLEVPIVLPGATIPIPIRISHLPSAYLFAFMLSVGTALVATMIAARRATQMNIVDALKKNV